ncbi:MAG: UTP--glucose-1-phosphate uridylyltransferase, partial [Verrucomicrobia bacterium]|nr:UTP--glucose-1-phosphate uridylyltransferase [Verrucomicrobiota bacterium]
MDATSQIRTKMESAGLNPAGIQAFLHQYKKLQNTDAGLVAEDSINPVTDLPSIRNHRSTEISSSAADSTVILKLNGGLGTSMGLDKAKSLLRVRDELTFLDIIVRQILALRAQSAPKVKLLFMDSFSTSEDTLAWLSRYPELGVPTSLELLQNKVPKIEVESLVPIRWPSNPALEWCPPGHGDIYASLIGS